MSSPNPATATSKTVTIDDLDAFTQEHLRLMAERAGLSVSDLVVSFFAVGCNAPLHPFERHIETPVRPVAVAG